MLSFLSPLFNTHPPTTVHPITVLLPQPHLAGLFALLPIDRRSRVFRGMTRIIVLSMH